MPSKPTRKSSKPAPSVGDIVRVVFLDHAENSKDALEFEVIGRLFEITKLAYKVRCWGFMSELDRIDGNSDNEMHYSLVKSAVLTIEVLR